MLAIETLLKYNNMEFNETNLPTDNKIKVIVVAKNKKEFEKIKTFLPVGKGVQILGYTTTFLLTREIGNEQNKLIFALIHTPKGIFVTNQIKPNLEAKDNLIKVLTKHLGINYIDKETRFLKRADNGLAISPSFIGAEITAESFKLNLSNHNTKKAYLEFYKHFKGKTFQHSKVKLKPDRVIRKNGFISIVEAERTFHNSADYYWKLKKLKGLERNFSKIILIFNGERNKEYHLEHMFAFERENKTKFKKVYYADMDSFEKFGEAALVLWK